MGDLNYLGIDDLESVEAIACAIEARLTEHLRENEFALSSPERAGRAAADVVMAAFGFGEEADA